MHDRILGYRLLIDIAQHLVLGIHGLENGGVPENSIRRHVVTELGSTGISYLERVA